MEKIDKYLSGLYSNNHAVRILVNQKTSLNKCLSEWDLDHYPDARRKREKMVKDIDNALQSIINEQHGYINK